MYIPQAYTNEFERVLAGKDNQEANQRTYAAYKRTLRTILRSGAHRLKVTSRGHWPNDCYYMYLYAERGNLRIVLEFAIFAGPTLNLKITLAEVARPPSAEARQRHEEVMKGATLEECREMEARGRVSSLTSQSEFSLHFGGTHPHWSALGTGSRASSKVARRCVTGSRPTERLNLLISPNSTRGRFKKSSVSRTEPNDPTIQGIVKEMVTVLLAEDE